MRPRAQGGVLQRGRRGEQRGRDEQCEGDGACAQECGQQGNDDGRERGEECRSGGCRGKHQGKDAQRGRQGDGAFAEERGRQGSDDRVEGDRRLGGEAEEIGRWTQEEEQGSEER